MRNYFCIASALFLLSLSSFSSDHRTKAEEDIAWARYNADEAASFLTFATTNSWIILATEGNEEERVFAKWVLPAAIMFDASFFALGLVAAPLSYAHVGAKQLAHTIDLYRNDHSVDDIKKLALQESAIRMEEARQFLDENEDEHLHLFALALFAYDSRTSAPDSLMTSSQEKIMHELIKRRSRDLPADAAKLFRTIGRLCEDTRYFSSKSNLIYEIKNVLNNTSDNIMAQRLVGRANKALRIVQNLL